MGERHPQCHLVRHKGTLNRAPGGGINYCDRQLCSTNFKSKGCFLLYRKIHFLERTSKSQFSSVMFSSVVFSSVVFFSVVFSSVVFSSVVFSNVVFSSVLFSSVVFSSVVFSSVVFSNVVFSSVVVHVLCLPCLPGDLVTGNDLYSPGKVIGKIKACVN